MQFAVEIPITNSGSHSIINFKKKIEKFPIDRSSKNNDCGIQCFTAHSRPLMRRRSIYLAKNVISKWLVLLIAIPWRKPVKKECECLQVRAKTKIVQPCFNDQIYKSTIFLKIIEKGEDNSPFRIRITWVPPFSKRELPLVGGQINDNYGRLDQDQSIWAQTKPYSWVNGNSAAEWEFREWTMDHIFGNTYSVAKYVYDVKRAEVLRNVHRNTIGGSGNWHRISFRIRARVMCEQTGLRQSTVSTMHRMSTTLILLSETFLRTFIDSSGKAGLFNRAHKWGITQKPFHRILW